MIGVVIGLHYLSVHFFTSCSFVSNFTYDESPSLQMMLLTKYVCLQCYGREQFFRKWNEWQVDLVECLGFFSSFSTTLLKSPAGLQVIKFIEKESTNLLALCRLSKDI